MSFALPYILRSEILVFLNVKLIFIIPTYAQTSNVKFTPTCFAVNMPSSGSLHVVLAKALNY